MASNDNSEVKIKAFQFLFGLASRPTFFFWLKCCLLPNGNYLMLMHRIMIIRLMIIVNLMIIRLMIIINLMMTIQKTNA